MFDAVLALLVSALMVYFAYRLYMAEEEVPGRKVQ